MGDVWVLQTETKGTGANMVPLERALKRSSDTKPLVVARKPRPRPEPAAQVAAARRFKVVDVMTRQVLAEGADTRATIDLLGGFRSIVDVNVYVWQEDRARWRLLTFAEQRMLWDYSSSSSITS